MSIAIDRPLTEDEKQVLQYCAIASVAQQSGATFDAAAAALDNATEQGEAHLMADAHDARIVVYGTGIAHMTREDLAAAAIEAAANKEAQ